MNRSSASNWCGSIGQEVPGAVVEPIVAGEQHQRGRVRRLDDDVGDQLTPSSLVQSWTGSGPNRILLQSCVRNQNRSMFALVNISGGPRMISLPRISIVPEPAGLESTSAPAGELSCAQQRRRRSTVR